VRGLPIEHHALGGGARPHEYGRNKDTHLADDPAFIFNFDDFLDRADRLDC